MVQAYSVVFSAITATAFSLFGYAAAGPPPCCAQKTVGNVSYTLIPNTNLDTSVYNCLSNCVYEEDGKIGSRFCFTSGYLPVSCGGAKMLFFGPGKILHASNFTSATECNVPTHPVSDLHGTVTVVIDDTLWNCGGHGSGDFQNSCYQLTGGAWVRQDNLTTTRYTSAGSVTSSGELLITGGYDGNITFSSTDLLSGGTWQAGPKLEEPIRHHCQVTLGDTVYIIGGYNGTNITNHAFSWTTGDATWTRLADMNTARWAPSCIVMDQHILVIGGVGGSRTEVERYEPRTDSWDVLPNLPVGMGFGQAGKIGNTVWAMTIASNVSYTTTDMVNWKKTDISDFNSGNREVFPAPLVTADIINC